MEAQKVPLFKLHHKTNSNKSINKSSGSSKTLPSSQQSHNQSNGRSSSRQSSAGDESTTGANRSAVRRLASKVAQSDWFNNSIICLIVLNSVCLALYDPTQSPMSARNRWIDVLDFVFQGVFTFEAIVRILHLGCHGYFSDRLNVCDFVLVVMGFVEYFNFFSASFVKVLRAFRVLRSFRLLKNIPGMVILLQLIEKSSKQLGTVVMLAGFIIFAFGILGVELFRTVPNLEDSFPNIIGFDNILQSCMTVFVVLGREGWVEIMESVVLFYPNSVAFFVILTAFGSVLALNLIVTVLVLNYKHNRHYALTQLRNTLYNQVQMIQCQAKDRKLVEDGFRTEVSAMHLMRYFENTNGETTLITEEEFKKYSKRFGKRYAKWKRQQSVTFSVDTTSTQQPEEIQEEPDEPQPKVQLSFPLWLEGCVCCVILYNFLSLWWQSFLMPLGTAFYLRVSTLVCASLFLAELLVRVVIAKGPKNLVTQSTRLQLFSYFIVLVGFPLVLLNLFQSVNSLRILHLFTVAKPNTIEQDEEQGDAPMSRLQRIEQMLDQLLSRFQQAIERWKKSPLARRFNRQKKLSLLKKSLQQVAPFSMILFLLMHVFAVAGLHLFGANFDQYTSLEGVTSFGYSTYLRAFVTTFQVLTGEGWNQILYLAVDLYGDLSALYFVTLLVLCNFIFLNLLLAIFIDAYINSDGASDSLQGRQTENQLRELELQLRKRTVEPVQYSVKPVEEKIGFVWLRDWMLKHRCMDKVGICILFAYCISLPFNSTAASVLLGLMYLEFVVRVILQDYGRSTIFDVVVVICASVPFWAAPTSTVAMSLRSLVVLRSIFMDKKVRSMVLAVMYSLPQCLRICFYGYMTFSLFTVLSIERYAGKFQRCITTEETIQYNKTCYSFPNEPNAAQYDLASCPVVDECSSNGALFWENPVKDGGVPYIHFDDYPNALFAMFGMATLEEWNDALYQGTQITRIGQAPERDASDLDSLYFVIVVCITHLLLLQLLIAVVIETFLNVQKGDHQNVLTISQRSFIENQATTLFLNPRKVQKVERHYVVEVIFRIVDSKRFERFICVVVLIDSLLMATQYNGEPQWKTDAIALTQLLFAIIYSVEALMKIVAYGRDYFKSFRNLFDLTIVVFAIIGSISYYSSMSIPNLTALRVLRIAVVIPSLRAFLQLISLALPSLLRVFRLFIFIGYTYTVAGTALCSETALFSDFLVGAQTLYVVSIGDEWNSILKTLEQECEQPAWLLRIFIVSFVFIMTFVVMNLFIAVLLKTFEQEFLRQSLDQLSLATYRREWFKASRSTDDEPQFLSPQRFMFLLKRLKPPVGLADFSAGVFKTKDMLKLVQLAKIPVTKNGQLSFNAVLFALSEFRYTMNTGEEVPEKLQEVAMKLHLTKDVHRKFDSMLRNRHPKYQLAHYLAASIIQYRFRKYKKGEGNAVRNIVDMFGWGFGRNTLSANNAQDENDQEGSEEKHSSKEGSSEEFEGGNENKKEEHRITLT